MTIQAQYSLITGYIKGTSSLSITDVNQIAALRSDGTGLVDIPDGKNNSTGMIDLATGQYFDVAPSIPIPSLLSQYIAAQINAGTLLASAFHPQTLSEINVALSAVNMTQVQMQIISSPTVSTT